MGYTYVCSDCFLGEIMFSGFRAMIGSYYSSLTSCQHWNTENKRSSIWKLCRHWWHRKLSIWQLTVPPVTTMLTIFCFQWTYLTTRNPSRPNWPTIWQRRYVPRLSHCRSFVSDIFDKSYLIHTTSMYPYVSSARALQTSSGTEECTQTPNIYITNWCVMYTEVTWSLSSAINSAS